MNYTYEWAQMCSALIYNMIEPQDTQFEFASFCDIIMSVLFTDHEVSNIFLLSSLYLDTIYKYY